MPQQHVKVSGRRNRRRAPTVGIDTLPDEVLWRMLSFFPVREAVQTCVLGRRWRNLWRYMPAMRIVSGDGSLTQKDVKDMNRFVNIFMFLLDRGAPLELCELKIDEFDVCENEPHISLWIQQALLSQARTLAVCDNCGDNGRRNENCMLLNGLSNAESLELVAPPGEFIFKRDLMRCPIFSKLKTLLLNEWCMEINFDALICFLEHTPVLEKLTLQLCQEPENWVEPRGFYTPSEEPFACSKLKIVEIKCREFDDRVHQISRMLSIFNTYIEQINIQWSARRSECYSFQTHTWDQLWY